MLPLDFDSYVKEICKGIKSRPRREEVEEELLCHLEDNYERNLNIGMNEEQARLNAIAKMGNGEALAYRLSAVNSQSPLKSMSSAFFSLVAGYICMNFFIKGIVNDILLYFGAMFMFSALLRMRKMNRTMEKAFHFFNFYVLTMIAFYCMQLGRELHPYVKCGVTAFALVIQAIFWIFFFVGLDKFYDPYIKEGKKEPNFFWPMIYHVVINGFGIFLVILSEGEDFDGDFPDFILPWIIIFMYFYGTVQLIRMRNILWDADGEYGILPNDKRHIAVFASVFAVIIGAVIIFNYASSTMESVKTELVIHDVSEKEQKEADKIRQKMLKWDVDPQIVEDLPDSEILNYKDAEFVTWGAEGGSMGGGDFETGAQSDLWYYWFFIPDKEYEGNYDVRLLCYIESHYSSSIKGLYRKGFYYMRGNNGIIEFNNKANKPYFGIISEEKGKKYNAEPFYIYKHNDPMAYPKGFEYHEEKGQRVYYAINMGISDLNNMINIHGATVRQRWLSPFQYYNTAGFIETILEFDRITSYSGNYHPFAYHLHGITTGNFDDKVFDLNERQSIRYDGGYPTPSDWVESDSVEERVTIGGGF